jgi:ubiquinone/menaquinone biosynthesis C-methylase UbiE
LALRHAEYAKLAYDRVAEAYDDTFGSQAALFSARLNEALRLRPGQRVVDLACGTGGTVVDMARAVSPGEVIGVDYSEGMLAEARERVDAEGVDATFCHARAEEFIAQAPAESFDVVSMRFVLAYVDWQSVLPGIGRIMRRGGRFGLLTSLSGSIPQFYELYRRFRKSPEPAWKLFQHTRRDLGATWRIYRQLKDSFGEPSFITVPDSPEQVQERLARGGLTPVESWTESSRMWFPSGREAVHWMDASGYVTHSGMQHLGPTALEFVQSLFAEGLESFREPRGIPIDLVASGVIADRL